MENQNIDQPENNVVSSQLQAAVTPPQLPSNKKEQLFQFIIVLLLLVIVGSGFYYLGNLNGKKESQTDLSGIKASTTNASPSTATKPTTKPTSNSNNKTENWKTHKIMTLGIELKLPEYLLEMDYPNGNEVNGEKGKQFCIQYDKSNIISFAIQKAHAGGGACYPTYFGLGTTSVDYEAGRMGGFGDLQGYLSDNGEYAAKMVLGKRFSIPSELATEITNSNGVKILKIIGKNSNPSDQDMPNFPISGTPGDGRVGALINLSDNSTYSGVSIEMKLDGNMNSELFDDILSTVVLTEN
jgi:hypothetical protein